MSGLTQDSGMNMFGQHAILSSNQSQANTQQ